MKNPKHTPGPWQFEFVTPFIGPMMGGRGQHMAIKGPNGEFICDPDGNGHEITADARLIVVAPDLLEALKAVIQDCKCSVKERYSGHLIDCSVPRALEIIAKAEGSGDDDEGIPPVGLGGI